METNIGTLIKNNLYDQRISIKELSKRLGLSRPTLYMYIKRNDMPVSLLYRISKAANHNFFQYLNPLTAKSAASTVEIPASDENTRLQHRIAMLEQENSYLKEINKLLTERDKRNAVG